jgi:hypothetical protein
MVRTRTGDFALDMPQASGAHARVAATGPRGPTPASPSPPLPPMSI